MKKNLAFSILALAILSAGCAVEVPAPQQDQVKKIAKAPAKDSTDSVKSSSSDLNVCDECKDTEEEDMKKKPVVHVCAKDTKVINYISGCKKGCSFPVTVRKESTCKKGDK